MFRVLSVLIMVFIGFTQTVNKAFKFNYPKYVENGKAVTISVDLLNDEIISDKMELVVESKNGSQRIPLSFKKSVKTQTVELKPLYDDSYTFFVQYIPIDISASKRAESESAREEIFFKANTLDHFIVNAPTTAIGGVFFNINIIAVDVNSDTVKNYSGPVALSTNGAGVNSPTLSTDSVFIIGQGVATIPFAYYGNGTITISVEDNSNSSFNGTSNSIQVSSPADHFEISIPDINNLVVGTPFDVVVRAKDAGNTTLTAFEGEIQLGHTFSGITNLPSNYTFVLADNGEHTFSNVVITVADTGRILASALGTNSLVAYYDFEDRVEDRAFGKHHGTNTAVTYVDGNIPGRNLGRAGDFNGTSSHVTIQDNSDLQFSNYTLAAWVKADGTQQEAQSSILGKGDRGTGINNLMTIANSGGIPGDLRHRVQVQNSLNAGENGYASATWTNWNHIAIRMSGTTITNWVNGVRVDGPQTMISEQIPNNDNFHIGREGGNSTNPHYYFAGTIDEVTIYNYGVADSVITNLYANSDPFADINSKSAEMIISPSTAIADLDISVSGDGFFNGVPFEVTIRGVDQYGNTIQNYRGPVNLTTNGAGNLSQIIVRDSLFISGTPGEATVFLTYDQAGTISITAADSIDGSYNASTSNLSFQNVADHFDVSVSNPEGLNAGQGFDITISPKNSSNVTLTTFEGEIKIGSTFSHISNLPSSYTFTLADNGVKTFSNVLITSADTGYVYVSAVGTQSLIAYYDFEDDVNDGAFSSHDGTNNSVSFEDGQIPLQNAALKDLGKAGRFDGATSYVAVDDAVDLRLSNYTLSAWVKMDVTQLENQSTVFAKGHRTSGINNMLTIDNTGFDMRHRVQTTTTLNNGENGYSSADFTEWHLLAIRMDNGTITNWVDGVLVDGPTAVQSAQVANSDPFHIGREASNSVAAGDYFAGLIDEVKIYNYALHDTLLMQDYLNPNPIAPLNSKSTRMIVSPNPVLHHLEISVAGSEFFNGVPFQLSVKGVDQYGNTLPNYNGPVTLSVNGGVDDSLSIHTLRRDQLNHRQEQYQLMIIEYYEE